MDKQRPVALFLHLPKCAGHSIYSLMQEQYGTDGTFIPYKTARENLDAVKLLSDAERRKIRAVAAHMPFGAHRFFVQSEYFTILRDPVSRVVSSYCYSLSNPGDHGHRIIKEQGLDLLGFARLFTNQQTHFLCMHWRHILAPLARLRSFALFEPNVQTSKVYLKLALAESKLVLNRCVAIGIQEEFEKSLRLLISHFNWNNLANRFENSSGSNTLLETLDPDTRKTIEDNNFYDRQLYEYARKLFQQQCLKYRIE